MALPPHRHLRPSQAISPSTALSHISDYLTSADTTPHLHPDCIFTEAGPAFSTNASADGLVLHQLRRVQAGLRGEHLAAEVDELLGHEGSTPALFGALPDARAELHPQQQGIEDVDAEVAVEEKSYNDQMEEQDRGGGITEGEVGTRSNGVVNGVKPVLETLTEVTTGKRKADGLDRAERKRAKKEREMSEKQERKKVRTKARDVENNGLTIATGQGDLRDQRPNIEDSEHVIGKETSQAEAGFEQSPNGAALLHHDDSSQMNMADIAPLGSMSSNKGLEESKEERRARRKAKKEKGEWKKSRALKDSDS